MNETIWLAIAGVAVPLVIQGIKAGYMKATGRELGGVPALNLTYAIAVVFALGARAAGGEVIVPAGPLVDTAPILLTQIGAVLALATVIYKSLLKPPVATATR